MLRPAAYRALCAVRMLRSGKKLFLQAIGRDLQYRKGGGKIEIAVLVRQEYGAVVLCRQGSRHDSQAAKHRHKGVRIAVVRVGGVALHQQHLCIGEQIPVRVHRTASLAEHAHFCGIFPAQHESIRIVKAEFIRAADAGKLRGKESGLGRAGGLKRKQRRKDRPRFSVIMQQQLRSAGVRIKTQPEVGIQGTERAVFCCMGSFERQERVCQFHLESSFPCSSSIYCTRFGAVVQALSMDFFLLLCG